MFVAREILHWFLHSTWLQEK